MITPNSFETNPSEVEQLSYLPYVQYAQANKVEVLVLRICPDRPDTSFVPPGSIDFGKGTQRAMKTRWDLLCRILCSTLGKA
jgi:hypothetical protein